MKWLRAHWPWVLVAAAALPRLYDAWAQHGMFWPDEIFQTVEQGHRLAFGYGMLPWEFVDGARSWIFPGFLGGVLKLGSLLGAGAFGLVVLSRVTMVAVGLSGMWAAMQLARRLAGGAKRERDAILLCGALFAALPPLLVFGAKCMSEMASAAVVTWAALLLLSDERRDQWIAGALTGLAIYLRYQNGVIAIAFLAWLLIGKRWKQARGFGEAAVVVGVLGGLLDWATWGQPFHSFIRYVQFNLLEGKAANWGQAPPEYYLGALWSSIGPSLLVIVGGLVLVARRAPVPLALIAIYLALHSMVPHKELRFLLPIVPLTLALAAAGLAGVIYKTGTWAAPALSLILVIALGNKAADITFEEMGQPRGLGNEFSFNNSPWRAGEGVNRVLLEASTRADLCGLLVDDIHPAVMGGYTYLHRDVPMLYYWGWAVQSANYRIAREQSGPRPGYERVFSAAGYVLERREGGCAPAPPGYDRKIR